MGSNRAIIKGSSIATTTLSSAGLLKPEQSETFLKMVFDSTSLGSLIRHEMRRATQGEIDKIGIGKRLLRKKTEDNDDKYRASVKPEAIQYSTNKLRLPWEITEDTLRENIEGEGFENTVTSLMATQMGLDSIDLLLNGDTATLSEDPDYDFLKNDDGFIKQIKTNGHKFDAQSSQLSLKTFYNLAMQVPSKYNLNGSLKWIMNSQMRQSWEYTLLNSAQQNGSTIPESIYKAPVGIPIVEEALVPDGVILLSNPQNLISVNTYNMILRKTTEGEAAVMNDKRFYVMHFDMDAVIEETDATGIITNIKTITEE